MKLGKLSRNLKKEASAHKAEINKTLALLLTLVILALVVVGFAYVQLKNKNKEAVKGFSPGEGSVSMPPPLPGEDSAFPATDSQTQNGLPPPLPE
ncbi:hypothetical protein HY640_04970 [Candidatus Woesearchaeota archaeon]|nr:hypothetical protein [Candidatus Woesearchaeota archaeon]